MYNKLRICSEGHEEIVHYIEHCPFCNYIERYNDASEEQAGDEGYEQGYDDGRDYAKSDKE